MDRHHRRGNAGRQHRLDLLDDRIAIGPPIELSSALDLAIVDAGVAGHDRAIGKAHGQRRVVGPAVGIDEQAGKCRKPRRRLEQRREPARHPRGADIVGDVTLERLGGRPRVP